MSWGQSKGIRRMHCAIQLVALIGLTTSLLGCDELNARQEIQKGSQKFKNRKFQAAAKHFESALNKTDNDEVKLVAHINAASTYAQIFNTLTDDDIQKEFRLKQISHLERWVEVMAEREQHCLGSPHSKEKVAEAKEKGKTLEQVCVTKKQGMKWLAALWEANEDYDKAIAYWQEQLKREPNDADAIHNVAVFLQKQEKFTESLDLMKREADVTEDLGLRVEVYESMVAVVQNNYRELPWAQSRSLVEKALVIVSDAAKDASDSSTMAQLLQSLYLYRAALAGSAWARAIEVGGQIHYQERAAELRKKEQQADEDGNDVKSAAARNVEARLASTAGGNK